MSNNCCFAGMSRHPLTCPWHPHAEDRKPDCLCGHTWMQHPDRDGETACLISHCPCTAWYEGRADW